SYFLQQVDTGNVARVTSHAEAIEGLLRRAVDPPGGDARRYTAFTTIRPSFAQRDDVLDRLLAHGVVVSARAVDDTRPLWQVLVLGFGPTLLLVGLFVLLLRRTTGIGSIGRSKARRYRPDGERTRFTDVAGIDEAEAELVEI